MDQQTAARERFQRADGLFHDALEQPPPRRQAWIDAQCGGDQLLQEEVHRLLTGHIGAGGSADFMEPPDAVVRSATGADADDLSSWIGLRLGQYTIRRLIGVGGMGAVFEAESSAPARIVALKIMRAGLLARAAVRRFERESRALARLRHPGIAQVIEAGAHENGDGAGVTPWIALELVPGARAITSFASHHKLDERSRLELFLRVCDAVHHGHLNGVIHRDLKPANLLIGEEPASNRPQDHLPKVIDFGVARLTSADETGEGASIHTAGGAIIGTLAYMSPEQCAGIDSAAGSATVDARGDVYSLGAVLHELLTGAVPIPVEGLPIIQAVGRIQTASLAPLAADGQRINSDLSTLVLKALAKDAADRYQSVAQLAADLRRYLANEPIEARPPTFIHQVRLMARRNRPAFVAAGAVLCVLVASSIVSAAFSVAATREATRAEGALQLARSERDRALQVAAFLKGVLGSGDPHLPMTITPMLQKSASAPLAEWRSAPWPYSGRPGRRATVTDLLTAASRRLSDAFAHDAAARAELGDTIGNALYNLGAHQSVVAPALKEAVAAAQEAFGDDHPSTILARCHLAYYLGRYEEGTQRPVYQAALDSAARLYGPSDPRTLEIVRFLAATMVAWRFEYRPAAELCLTWVDKATQTGADHGGVWILRSYAGFALAQHGDIERAEQLGRLSVADAERNGGDPLALAEVRRSLSQILAMAGRPREAIPLTSAALPVYEEAMGPSSHQTMHVLNELARLHRDTGDNESALAISRRVVDIAARLEGDSSYNATYFRQDLAIWLMNLDREPQERQALAERLATGRLLALEEESPGQTPAPAAVLARIWVARVLIADAMMAQSPLAAEGEARLRTLVDELDQSAAPETDAQDHPPLVAQVVARYRFAARLIRLDRLDEAETLLEASRERLSRIPNVGGEYERRRAQIESELRAARGH